VRYYCPNCWQDFWEENFKVCPKCGYDIKDFDNKDYVDKLITALQHRAGDVRHWVIMILAQRKEKRAVPYLDKLCKETKDPSLARAAEEAIKKINAEG
jgi:HEAT repeat protein